MKTLKFIALFMALLPLTSRAQQADKPCLCIEKTDGEIISVAVSDNYPNLSYTTIGGANHLSIEFEEGVSTNVPCSEIKQIFTKMCEVTGIETVSSSAAEETKATVYTVSGVQVNQHPSYSLPKGVYVVKKGNKTIKTVNP